MPKLGIFIRTNKLTRKQLDELCQRLNETQAGIFAIALDRMHRDEIKDKDDEKEKASA